MKTAKRTAKFTLMMTLTMALAIQPLVAMAQAEEHTHDETCGNIDGACLVVGKTEHGVTNRVACAQGGECDFTGVQWTPATGLHSGACTKCNSTTAFPCTEDTGTVTIAATTSSPGEMTFNCSECGQFMRTEPIPQLSKPPVHTHNYNWIGYHGGHRGECSCGDFTKFSAHEIDNGTLVLYASDPGVTHGYRSYRCKTCEWEMARYPVESHGCNLEWKHFGPEHWQQCTVAYCWRETEHTRHDEDNPIEEIIEPTYTETGLRKLICKCGYVFSQEVIDKITHVHKYDEIGFDDSSHWYQCSCGDKKAGTTQFHLIKPDKYFSDEHSHWNTCEMCDVGPTNITPHSTTDNKFEQTAGYHYQVCSTCGGGYNYGEHKEDVVVTSAPTPYQPQRLVYYTCYACKMTLRTELKYYWEIDEYADGWNHIEVGGKKSWYYFQNGYPVRNEWVMYKGDWYFLKEDGTLATGWTYKNETQSNINSPNVTTKRVWYLFDADGKMLTGWQKVDGTWYYLGTNGKLQTGWVKWNDSWYYTDADGKMQIGWYKVDGHWYHADANGKLQTGWYKLTDGYWYYANENGQMQTGWITHDGARYYLSSGGKMYSGGVTILFIDGAYKKCHFDKNGKLYKTERI